MVADVGAVRGREISCDTGGCPTEQVDEWQC
jgi:hypothetical protein